MGLGAELALNMASAAMPEFSMPVVRIMRTRAGRGGCDLVLVSQPEQRLTPPAEDAGWAEESLQSDLSV